MLVPCLYLVLERVQHRRNGRVFGLSSLMGASTISHLFWPCLDSDPSSVQVMMVVGELWGLVELVYVIHIAQCLMHCKNSANIFVLLKQCICYIGILLISILKDCILLKIHPPFLHSFFHLCQKRRHMWRRREIGTRRIKTNSVVCSIFLLYRVH